MTNHAHAPDTNPARRSKALLAARGISKNFDGIAALTDAHFDLIQGEIHALVGENGAGKSTLMKILSGVYDTYEGEISIEGELTRFSSVREAEAAGIAIIHQELNLVPELTVADNIFLGREPRIAGLFLDRKKQNEETGRLLARLGIDLDPNARVSELRVGEQQLIEIAKALSLSARILIMDEPTSALSQSESDRLFRVVKQLAAEGVGVVYISHRIDEVVNLADRITVLRDGRHVLTRPMSEMTQDSIVAAMVGRELFSAEIVPPGERSLCVLSVSNLALSKAQRNGWRDVIQGVGFNLHAGEILGIAGLLGSGRTEILQTLFGSARGKVSGEIALFGERIEIGSPRDARRLGIAMVTEDRKAEGLHLDSSITENVTLPLVGQLATLGLRSFKRESEIAQQAVRSLGIRCNTIEQAAKTLSGGNQQKVVIAKWLATQPRIFLLDEPTRGIDVGAKREIYNLIFKLSREQGFAILVVSSELPELLYLADNILVMAGGRQRGVLSRADATEEKIMLLAAPGGTRQAAA